MLSVALQTCFVPDTGDIEELRKLCATLQETEGVTTVKNPWSLAPWRTFPDVAQPTSPWVLRSKERGRMPVVGLFETGNAGWMLEAVSNIAVYLRTNLVDWTVLG